MRTQSLVRKESAPHVVCAMQTYIIRVLLLVAVVSSANCVPDLAQSPNDEWFACDGFLETCLQSTRDAKARCENDTCRKLHDEFAAQCRVDYRC